MGNYLIGNVSFLCLSVYFLIFASVVIALLGRSVIGSFRDGREIIKEYKREPRTSSQKVLFFFFWFNIAVLIISIFFVGR